MMPLVVLVVSFLLLLIVNRFYHKVDRYKAGRIAFSLMFVFTGLSHFAFTEGMVMSMPDVVPIKRTLVYFTGLLEIGLAILFLIDRYKRLAAILIIAFLITVFPANVWAAVHHIDIQQATYDGPGLSYLWFRVPLQLFFIAWVYYFGIRRGKDRHSE